MDEKVIISQNKGIPVLGMHAKSARAFMNAARAITNPRVVPVDLNSEDNRTKDGKIFINGKECRYES